MGSLRPELQNLSQISVKNELHHEIKTQYREFFESRLAISLLDQPEIFLSVKKISAAIIEFINLHPEIVLAQISSNIKIREELFNENYFGRLNSVGLNSFSSANLILNNILKVLSSADAPLDQVMQLHAIFIHRIYDYLPGKIAKSAWTNVLFSDELFHKNNRGRSELEKIPKLTTQLGVCHSPVFKKMIKQGNAQHHRAIDRFSPEKNSSFFSRLCEHHLPFVAGPSGHAASLLLGAKLYGNLVLDELKEYAMACFAFLAAGGNHSFTEVMVVANRVGVPIEHDNYAVSFSDSLKLWAGYKWLERLFPEFLKKAEELTTEPRLLGSDNGI